MYSYGVPVLDADELEFSDLIQIYQNNIEREKRLYDVLNWNFANLMALIYNIFSRKKKIKPEDLIGNKSKHKKRMTNEEMLAKVEILNVIYKGKDLRKSKTN